MYYKEKHFGYYNVVLGKHDALNNDEHAVLCL